MRCPFCGESDTAVKDSRVNEDEASIKRRRFCAGCGARFTTFERAELRHLMVLKRDGTKEAFDREKLARSIMTALRKRPYDPNQVERVISSLVRQFETRGEAEITTQTIGNIVLETLSGIDPVAYLRFASVYRDFSSVHDFVAFISSMGEEVEKD